MAHKAGFINIIGYPNVGKSTLMNALVGERLSIITSKAQTTRHRIMGIVNGEDFQLVFSDTPGIIKPAYRMQENMMEFVKNAFEDADILLYIVELGEKELKSETFQKRLRHASQPLFILINKIDKGDPEQLSEAMTHWQEMYPEASVLAISALEQFGTSELMNALIEELPESPPFYPKDQLTDKPERFFVNETIREKILMHYKKEIPYSVEVDTEEFLEDEDIIRMRSVIMVERDSQKGIIIGHKGNAIKRVGTEARKDLEKFFGKKVHIELFVKVNKDWRSNQRQLKRFGYDQ